jgi:hypothetical protein
MKMIILWDAALYISVKIVRRIIGAYCIRHHGSGSGISKNLRNVSHFLRDFTA